jgi:hypothetical protein
MEGYDRISSKEIRKWKHSQSIHNIDLAVL